MKKSPLVFLIAGLVVGLCIGLALTPVANAGEFKIALWLEIVHRVCTSFGGLGTCVALIIVIRQFYLLREQTDLVQKNIVASMDSQLYGRLDSFNKFIVEHYREYAALDQPYEGQDATEERPKLHHLCDLGFTFFEEIYKHHARFHLLNNEDWEEWQQNLNHFFSKPYVRGYWKTVAARYAKSFQAYANEIVDGIGPE